MMNAILLLATTWITAMAGQGEHRPALRLARDFTVAKPVAKATLEATALGLYKPFVNGREVTDRRLMPGWTQYDARVLKQSFDVTSYLKEGTNTLAALVGRGWFCGIFTDPEYERRGIATVLFNLLMQEFIAEGATFSTLFTGVENHAQRIYLRTGFRVVRKFSIMHKEL